ncbi:MAG TPA: FAD-binding oxidoreductase [Steroidobacteraceae bacterium]|nr:FAD-binding oxidoreductase [Steroidobacteraceae bacterium]
MPAQVDRTVADLRQALGVAHVLTDDADRRFYSQDVYRSGELPAAVIQPGTVEELAVALRIVAAAGLAVVPRGGGMSYTDGYLPSRPDSITVDLLRLNRVVEINPDDCYVTVECGATWKDLLDALAPRGVRTPYWGPLSGVKSSIGGALSQGSIFLGSGRYGTAADSVLGLDVVLVDGTLMHLGSHANGRGQPFLRQFGPDSMGMFLSDCGALGIKTRATFRLVRIPAETRHVSFAFDTADAMFHALAEVARNEIVSESFGFDPGLQAQRMKRTSFKSDVKALGNVMKAAGGKLAGLKEGAKVVLAGRSFLDDAKFSAHLSFDGRDAVDVDSKVAVARRILSRGGNEVENTVPKVMRANPFAEVTSMLGPNGERWVPVHGTVPFSKAPAMFAALDSVFAKHGATLEQYDIDHGYLFATVGIVGTLIEPVMFWPDERLGFHERVLDADYLAKLPKYPQNLPARAAVMRVRDELAQCFMEHGAVSFQLGKFYKYQQGLEPSAATFLQQLKRLVDPQGRMNPDTLGLS